MMNRLIIYEYINRLKYEDIVSFCNYKGININKKDLDIVYDYVKHDYKRFFNNPINVLEEVKEKVNTDTYEEIMTLYNKYKHMIN